MTDFDRDDALDDLTSEELERQAFGPDPDAKRSLRGLVDRPTSGAVTYHVAERKRRWPKVLLGLAAVVAVLVSGVAIGVDMERQPAPVMERIESPADAVPVEDAEVQAFEDAMEAEAEAMEAAIEAEAEALEDAIEAEVDALNATLEAELGR